jgi:hypothetical protein
MELHLLSFPHASHFKNSTGRTRRYFKHSVLTLCTFACYLLPSGGQFELSGAPVATIQQTCAEVNNHLYQVRLCYGVLCFVCV